MKGLFAKSAVTNISDRLNKANKLTVGMVLIAMMLIGVTLSGFLIFPNIIDSGRTQAALVAENVGIDMVAQDKEKAAALLASLRNTEGVEQALLFDRDDQLFASFSPLGESLPVVESVGTEDARIIFDELIITQPVTYQGQYYGYLYLQITLESYYQDYLVYINILLLFAVLIYVLSRNFSKKLGKSIVEPIVGLTGMMQEVTRYHRLDLRAESCDISELNVLVKGFNSMLAQLESDNIQILESQDRLETEVARRTEELLKAKNEAEQANTAKSKFLSQMSHELRTPMNAILGFSQMLEYTTADNGDMQKQYIKEILLSGEHLLTLIDGVLDLAKIESESGEFNLANDDCNLAEAIGDAIRMTRPLMDDKKIKLTLKHKGEKAELGSYQVYVVKGDLTRLKQVFINMLSNAVKYNRDGGEIILDVEAPQGEICISVKDTGLGIESGKQGDVFKPFERLGFEGSNVQGAGIGLVISKYIIENMGGKIGFSSIAGKGSNFWVTLPWSGDISDFGDLEENSADHTDDDEAEVAVKILYIEDNLVNQRLVEEIIRRVIGCQFLKAANPYEGLDLAAEHLPTLILLDINLPEMDGYGVLKHLKESPETRNIPVIAVSANAMEEDIKKAEDLGFDEYLVKPFKLQELCDLVRKYLPDSP